jgi:hypothetical protein
LIRCTIDPQINHEARINHVNVTIIVKVCEFLALMRHVKLLCRCEAAGCRAAAGSRPRKTGGRGGPATVRRHAT